MINTSKIARVLIGGILWLCLITVNQVRQQTEQLGTQVSLDHLTVDTNDYFSALHQEDLLQGLYFEISEVEEENENDENHSTAIQSNFERRFLVVHILSSFRSKRFIGVFQPRKYLLFHDLKIDC